MTRWSRCLGGVLACVAGALIAAPAQAVTFRNGFGLRVTSSRALDSRLIALTVSSAAIPGPAKIRVLLPTGYAAHPRRHYPVLYLLHGTSGSAADWTTLGDAEKTTAGRQLIVVMPDIGLNGDGGGWCANWVRGAHRQWETFQIGETVPWIDTNLRTIPERGSRAVAGLSQGGFCSTSIAARHPDMFGIALSYSGVPDIAYDAAARGGFAPVLAGIEAGLDHVPAGSIFGAPATHEVNWAGHDPATLAANLRHTKLFLYTGNGLPGPLDPPSRTGRDTTETGVHLLTQLFHQRLIALHIPSFYEDYGPGTHSWPYWTRDLRESIGPLMNAFARRVGAPPRFDFTSADATYSIYGWNVVMHRRVQEFSSLTGVDAHGFTLSGCGSATVTTPSLFAPGGKYAVTAKLGDGSVRLVVLRAGRDGALHIGVKLGPSNTVSGFPAPRGLKVFKTRVAIRTVKR